MANLLDKIIRKDLDKRILKSIEVHKALEKFDKKILEDCRKMQPNEIITVKSYFPQTDIIDSKSIGLLCVKYDIPLIYKKPKPSVDWNLTVIDLKVKDLSKAEITSLTKKKADYLKSAKKIKA